MIPSSRTVFELTTPDVFEIAASGRGRRLFVEEDRDLEASRDFRCGLLSQRDTLGHGDVIDGHKRHDVHRAEPWMFAGVRAQIDVFDRRAHQGENSGLQRFGLAGHRQDRAVVCRVGRRIEHAHAIDGSHRTKQRRNDLGPSPFAHVRHALDHGLQSTVTH